MRSLRVVLCGALAIMTVPIAQAQEGPATGFALWTRILGGSAGRLTSVFESGGVVSPQFVVGYQGTGFSLGLAGGVNKLSDTDKDTDPSFGGEDKTTITGWQLGPSALINFWHSPDHMTRGNIALEATYGKISAKRVITTNTGTPPPESKASGNVLGLRLGVGGDYFFGEHFGLGAEVGFEGTFVSDLKDEVPGNTFSTDLSAVGAYGSLRVTLAL